MSSAHNPTPLTLFGFSGKSPTELENLINILKHSSDLPKGFCVIASYKLPIEKQSVLQATLDILFNILPTETNADEESDANASHMLLFGILLIESLLESPIVRKFAKKEHYHNLANQLIPLIFNWANSISPQNHPEQLRQLFESTALRCFQQIRVIFKSFPLLISNILARSLEEFSQSDNVLTLVSGIVHKLKFRKTEGIRNGFLDAGVILKALALNQLSTTEMDTQKEKSIDLVSDIYRMVRNKSLMEEYINADTLNDSPLTLSAVRDYMTLIDEEDEQQKRSGEADGVSPPKLRKRQSSNNMLNSQHDDSHHLPKSSSSSTLATSQFQFNENSSITKELLKTKIKKSTLGPPKNPTSSFRRPLTQLTHLSLENSNITSIDNLQYCTNLRVLYLSNNHIQTIEGLENLVHLTQLYLQNNQIRKIEGLSTLTSLKKLHLEQNFISCLEGLTQNRLLSELFLSNQSETTDQHVPASDGDTQTPHEYYAERSGEFFFDLATLYNLQHSLSVLSLSNCRVRSASDLSVLNNMQKLDLSKNQITNMDSVSQLLTNNFVLYELDLSDNPVCGNTKYRDQIIINSTHSLQILDKKPIQANVRSFLLNKRKHQLSAKGKRKAKSAPTTEQVDLQLNIARPRLYTGPKQKENQRGISMQNLDVKRR
eukprot:CAMPEP_0117447784 /NCGR_PEP_ID=MMETSP0759-20121206/7057_1 /TAXON_ID=63605 /ORGANISM="Percolomonas cosmopolitus, Strain WS" /LENGTH=657 /DNA_ID=CAMNT_0005240137 /DNA_START=1 /DNA_END=1974 /DNA_ORIENTATION=+